MDQKSYLAGVILGDGWCTRLTIGLRVSDQEFAEAFAAAIREVYRWPVVPKLDERGYWLTRVGNKRGTFNELIGYEPGDAAGKAAWLRGLFDSEGNAYLGKIKRWENSWTRRVAFYSTNTQTLARAEAYLLSLGIASRVGPTKPSRGHLGDKTVHELDVNPGKTNYVRFAKYIGSSIPRKRSVLDAIPASYTTDRTGACRCAQRKGAASKRAQTIKTVLPVLVQKFREMIDEGVTPTYRNCLMIPGYYNALRFTTHRSLVALARSIEP